MTLFRPANGTATAPDQARTGRPAPVQLVNLKKNDAALTDPTPLFLPTEWNAAQDPLPESARREPGSSFAGYPAKLKFAQNELTLTLPPPVEVPANPSLALELGRPPQTFLGLNPESNPVKQLAARKAFVEIVSARDGEPVMTEALSDASPPDSQGGWQPMEFLVAVDAMGLVGPPILTESSRVPGVDGYFRIYLEKSLRVGQRLAPGFYRISVGP
ncbi:MAG: hypothetical protein JSR48_09960 [Verrucomicrobia bacterium]|nr:hypothetical protein [Verrucomicrobiota bacterium]